MDHQDVEELLTPFLMGELLPEQVRQIESHLLTCSRCKALVEDNRLALDALVQSLRPVPPPGRVREGLLRALEGAELRPRRIIRQPRGLPGRWAPVLASIAVLLLVGVTAINIWLATRTLSLQSENKALTAQLLTFSSNQERLAKMMDAQRYMFYILAIPGTKIASLSSGEGPASPRGLLMVDAKGNWAVLVASGLKPQSISTAYQVWLRDKSGRSHAGTLLVDESGWGYAILRPGTPLINYSWVGVTLEQMDDPQVPAGSPILGGNIPR